MATRNVWCAETVLGARLFQELSERVPRLGRLGRGQETASVLDSCLLDCISAYTLHVESDAIHRETIESMSLTETAKSRREYQASVGD